MSNTDDNTSIIDTTTEAGRQLVRNENADARSQIDDPTGTRTDPPSNVDQGDGGAPQEPEARTKPINMTPNDEKRAMMAKRFRRSGDSVPFNGDANDPEMQFGDVARVTLTDDETDPQEPEPAPRAPEPQARPDPTGKTFTIKVRGRDVQMTEAEVISRVQKIEAADTYFEDARNLLEAAKEIRREGRSGPAPQHPEGDQTGTRTNERDVDPPEATRHPGKSLKDVVEKIQFGDPEEAARDLREAIDESTDRKADERQLRRLMDNDAIKSRQSLKAFVEANPDLNQDEIAAQMLEQQLYRIYYDEIVKLGVVDKDKIPDPRTNARDLAEWHRFYRVHGHQMSTAAQALEESKERLLKWRGVSAKPTDQPRPKPAPTVKVNVERTARREAIPNNPTRSVSPRPSATPPATRNQTRSDVIAGMRKSRGQSTV